MGNNDKQNINQALAKTAINVVSDLTPISVKEAKSVLGDAVQYASDEAVASAILDFTAIARAYLRTVPKYKN